MPIKIEKSFPSFAAKISHGSYLHLFYSMVFSTLNSLGWIGIWKPTSRMPKKYFFFSLSHEIQAFKIIVLLWTLKKKNPLNSRLSNYFYVLDSLCCSFPEAINLNLMAKGLWAMNKIIILCPWRILIAYQDNLLTTTDIINLLYVPEWMSYIFFIQSSLCLTPFNSFCNSFTTSNLKFYFLARFSGVLLSCRDSGISSATFMIRWASPQENKPEIGTGCLMEAKCHSVTFQTSRW